MNVAKTAKQLKAFRGATAHGSYCRVLMTGLKDPIRAWRRRALYCVEDIPQCSAKPGNLALNSGSVHLTCMHVVGEEGKLLAAAPAVPSSLLYAAFKNENENENERGLLIAIFHAL